MINGRASEQVIRLPTDILALQRLLSARSRSASIIQQWYRLLTSERRAKLINLISSLEDLRSSAAKLIQKYYKGFQARKDLKFLKGSGLSKLIRWSHSSTSVFVSGSFTVPPWKILVPLTYCKTLKLFISTFLIDNNVPRGAYSAKFLVDGQWLCDGNLPITQEPSGVYNNVLIITDDHKGMCRAMSVKSFQSGTNELSSQIKTQTLYSPILFVRSISGNLDSPRGFGIIEKEKIKDPIRLVMAGHMIGKPTNRHAPLKEAGSADAWFTDAERQAFGVADGVSEWSTFGLDPSKFSAEIMKHCASLLSEMDEEEQELTDFFESIVLEALQRTNSYGSSTVLLAMCRNSFLYTYCLGDSSFIVLRKRDETNTLVTVYRSIEQQHSFNCPFQLSNLPKPHKFEDLQRKGFSSLVTLLKRNSKCINDSPFDANTEMIPLKVGDIIIAGSDGLFDNLYDVDIIKAAESALMMHTNPQQLAKFLASTLTERAILRGWDTNYRSPFARNAGKAGKKYMGGKLDDTTVIVAIST